jgi:uncharacterized protein
LQKQIEVIKAIYLLFLSLALSFALDGFVLMGTIIREGASLTVLSTLTAALIIYSIPFFLATKVLEGRFWAQSILILWCFLLVVLLALAYLTPDIIYSSILRGALALMAILIQVVVIYLLSKRTNWTRFDEKEKNRHAIPHVNVHEEDVTTIFKHLPFIEILTSILFVLGITFIISGVLGRKGILQFPFVAFNCEAIVLIGAIYYLSRRYPKKTTLKVKSWKIVVYGVLLGSVMPSLLSLPGYLNGRIPQVKDYAIFIACNNFERALWFATTVGVAPVVEELLFRGCIYRILKDQYRVFWAVLLTNMLFAVAHFGSGVWDALLIFLTGIFYTLAYEKTGNVRASIISHSLNNLVYFFSYCY